MALLIYNFGLIKLEPVPLCLRWRRFLSTEVETIYRNHNKSYEFKDDKDKDIGYSTPCGVRHATTTRYQGGNSSACLEFHPFLIVAR